MTAAGIRLEPGSGGAPLTRLAEVNDVLAAFGSRVWPLELGGAPADLRAALGRPSVTQSEAARIKAHFLLSREHLLEKITEAGRAPHVAGGGELASAVINHGYSYPQLFVVDSVTDYRWFDRFHVNTGEDGTGVDEVMQVLSGGGIRILQRRPGLGETTLHLDCPAHDAGWIVTYDGSGSHIGSFSTARPGTKVLMQVIGPARWTMRYDEDG